MTFPLPFLDLPLRFPDLSTAFRFPSSTEFLEELEWAELKPAIGVLAAAERLPVSAADGPAQVLQQVRGPALEVFLSWDWF